MPAIALRPSTLLALLPVALLWVGCGSGGSSSGTTGVFTGSGTGGSGFIAGGNGNGTSGKTSSSSGTTSGATGTATHGAGTTSGAVGTTSSSGSSGSCPTAGQSCFPANICDLGVVACNNQGVASCVDQGQPNASQNGQTCDGSGGVCDDGTCATCSEGASCQPTDNVCDLGTLDCSTGIGICDDTGNPNTAADGQTCESTGTCSDGTCVLCSQGASCTPTDNICDLGSIDCSGGGNGTCEDEGEPNPGQNGVTCSLGQICDNGACITPGTTGGTTGTTTTGGTSGATNWPIVPDQGQPVVSSPNLIFMTYSDDPNQSFFNQYAQWIADGGYLPTVAGQYGVGNGTWQTVNLGNSSGAPTGTTTNQNAFPDYLEGLMNSSTIPPYGPNNEYVLILPSTWSDTTTFCQTAGGYHTYDPNTGALYAIIPNCLGNQQGYLDEIEVAISHEVVEGSTDPLIESYQIQDMTNPWFYLGGEVGDLCASNNTYYTSGQFVAQLIWSNEAVSAGEVPCQPWPSGQTYLSLTGPSTMASAPPGGQAVVTLTGWASGPYSGDIGLYVTDGDYYVDFSTSPVLGAQQVAVGGTVTVTLSVPAGTPSGSNGAAWVLAEDMSTFEYVGSIMVGVTVQ